MWYSLERYSGSWEPRARDLKNWASMMPIHSGDAEAEELVFDDVRVIDMYEAAIRHDLKMYQDRKGNWVQKFGAR